MVIAKPEDLKLVNDSFNIKSLEKFCDEDAFKAIEQLYRIKFHPNKQNFKDDMPIPPKKMYNTRCKKVVA